MGDLHGFARAPRLRMNRAAAKTSALLCLLFLIVYNATNWITSQRSGVGTWYFGWELDIPFVAWMIIPYMSIDLFFVAGPFLCRDEAELGTLRRRIVMGILVAGLCFLLFPLRLGFVKPEVHGWLGAIFVNFLDFDKPYNLCPSLHIVLRTILASLYVRHTRGALRIANRVWFSLIGFSTVLTYQHQVIDVIGGFMLATLCFYFVPDPAPKKASAKNLRLAAYYGAGAAAFVALAIATRPLGAIFLWPALSMAIATGAYCGLGPEIFRKSNGRIPFSAKLVLGPLLLGQQLSLLYYRRQCRPWNEATPSLLIGRKLNDAEAARAIQDGVASVLDLTGEFSEANPFLAIDYRNIQIMDLTAPTRDQLSETTRFIGSRIDQGKVYVHCKIGYSRSAAVVGAFLIAASRASSAEEAIATLRKARPAIIVRPEAMQALNDFAGSLPHPE